MKKLKNTFNFLLCLSLASSMSDPFYACAVPDISEPAISSNNSLSKSAQFGTYYRYVSNYSAASARGYRKMVYDIYAKYDTNKFDESNYERIFTQSSRIISNVKARKYNTDGSYISAEVVGFEPAQVDFFQFAFPANGVYTCDVSASSGTTATFELEIDNVISSTDSSDKKAPELSIKVPSLSEYRPGSKIKVNIEADEICRIETAEKTYASCTGVDLTFSADGVYSVKATDINGNSVTKSFTIDLISRSTTTTTTKKTTITTTKPVPTLCGDANMDGKVTIADSTAILQSIGNPDKYELSEMGYINADCYEQGNGVTANDAIAIQMYDAKAVTALPIK